MIIRLGYVSISKTLTNITASSNYTYSNFSKNNDYNKLDRVIISNLEDLIKILNYNVRNNIHFYRITSNLIPLAIHEMVDFDYINPYIEYYRNIGNIINRSNMRVDFHPSLFCVLNSTRRDVVLRSIEILKYHYNLLNAMNIKDKILILHVGSSQLGRGNSIKRFINNFKKLPLEIRKVIAIENDDKVFTIDDVIYISKQLDIPVVLDYHHYLCNKGKYDILYYINDIIASWKGRIPKMHFSCSKSKKDIRAHSDYIDIDSFLGFINILKGFNTNIDIMLEVKEKDEAMFRLIRNIKFKTDYVFIDDTSFLVDK